MCSKSTGLRHRRAHGGAQGVHGAQARGDGAPRARDQGPEHVALREPTVPQRQVLRPRAAQRLPGEPQQPLRHAAARAADRHVR